MLKLFLKFFLIRERTGSFVIVLPCIGYACSSLGNLYFYRFVSLASAGTSAGMVVSQLTCSFIIHSYDWSGLFYLYGSLGFCWVGVWYYYVLPILGDGRKLPSADSESMLVQLRELCANWMKLLSFKPVMALFINNICVGWVWYTILNFLPLYFYDNFNINTKHLKSFTVLPWIVAAIASYSFGVLSDKLVASRRMSLMACRSLFQLSGLLGPSLCLLVLLFLVTTPLQATICMSALMGFHSLTYSGAVVNAQDIAPDLAGMVYAISNTGGQLSGVVAPLINGMLLEQRGWGNVFALCLLIYGVGAIVWMKFASTKKLDLSGLTTLKKFAFEDKE